VNKLNIYNQVGVVALNVIGEPITPDGGGAGYMAQQADPHGRPRHAGLADVALDLDVDPVTAMKIREIYALKEAAVAREDYDEAKRLKDGINRLKAVGAKVAQLEAKKSSAIEAEDYDAAKLIKVEIDKLREAGGVTALGESVGVRGSYRERENEPADQIFNRALDAHGANPMSPPKQPQQPAPVMEFTDHGPDAAADAYEDDDRYEDPTQTSAPMPDPGPPGPPQNDYYDAGGLSPAQLKQLRATAGPDDVPPAASNTYGGRDYDERPAVSKAAAAQMQGDGGLPTPTRFRDNDPSALGANNDEVPALATGRGGSNQFSEDEMMGGGGGGGGGGNADAPPKPPGFGGGDDLPAPDPIPPSMEGDARPIVEAFGEYCAMCLYSKNWMHREAALADMEKKVSSGDVKGDQREIFRVLCQHFGRLFKDKVANVFAATCKLLTSATRKMGPSLGPREVHSEVSPLVVLLLERLGDAHVKVRLLPVRPRSRGERRSLRTFPVVTLHPRFPFNVRLTGKTFD
jgi:centrosomal protein CEP104